MARILWLGMVALILLGCRASAPKQEVQAYLTFVTQQSDQMSAGFQEISALSDLLESRLYDSEQWRGDMYRATGRIRQAAEAIIAYDAVPAGYAEVHEPFVETARLCLSGITLFEEGVETQDNTLLDAGTAAFAEARLRLQEVLIALQAVVDS